MFSDFEKLFAYTNALSNVKEVSNTLVEQAILLFSRL